MKKIYVVLVAVLLVGSLSAQAQFKFGIKAGANFSKFSSTDPNVQAQNLTAWHGGLMAEIKLPIIGIQADALYTQNGTKFDGSQALQEIKSTYIQVPVVAKVYILKVLNIQAGPQFGFLTGAKDGENVDIKDQLESSDLQIVFGAGLDLGPLNAALRYNIGVKDINKDLVNYDLKNNAFTLSVGIWLKK
ncbi:MAG: PorT family protein [Cyclobacteriaceae bacterium]|nr:PorT family protein [Cyclobacteriaceae bacterium]